MRRILPSVAAVQARTRLILISMLAVTAALTAPGGRAAEVAAYGQLPTTEDVAISPDGSRLAYVHTKGDERIVVIANVADHKMIRWVKASDAKLRLIEWVDQDNLMIESSLTTSVYGFKDEWFFLKVYNVPRNELRSLPGTPMGARDDVVDTVVGTVMARHVAGHTDLFVPGLYQDAGVYQERNGVALFRCDLTTGITTLMDTSRNDPSWLLDSQGQIAAEESYDEQSQSWSIALPREGHIRLAAVSGHAPLDSPQMLGFGPTSDTVLVQAIEGGHRVWQLLSMQDGKISPMPDASVFDYALLDPSTGRMVGGENLVDLPQYTFFDAAREVRWQAILKALGGDEVDFVSASSDFSKVVVRVQGPDVGYRYILIDLTKSAAMPIGNIYAGIDSPLEVRPIDYPAGDGLNIHAYLTLPSGRPAHGLALVVLPHGGPQARDTAQFDWWSQALADQGYAVLRPNFRGSSTNVHLTQAGYGQWGRKMQTDLSDGVSYLVKQGIVDPGKVCIVGASYGGYAALAGVTLEPTVYRCAVSVAGISDLAKMLQWEGRGGLDAREATRYWDRFWGVSGSSDPKLDTISPIRHVDAVRAPVLLIHGRDDTIVPFEQSQMMFDALRHENKEVQLVALNHEDHGLSHGDTRTQMLEATVDFLRAHNPPN